MQPTAQAVGRSRNPQAPKERKKLQQTRNRSLTLTHATNRENSPRSAHAPFCTTAKLLASRGNCSIYTTQGGWESAGMTLTVVNESRKTPHRIRLSRKSIEALAPNPGRRLWTACTRLKMHVLTNVHFSLTEKIEGVQQDRSLTAS